MDDVERVADAMWESRGNPTKLADTENTALIAIYRNLARAALAAMGPVNGIKTLSRLLLDKLAHPNEHQDMNDETVNWEYVYKSMRDAQSEQDHMNSVLCAALVAISGFDPWDDDPAAPQEGDD